MVCSPGFVSCRSHILIEAMVHCDLGVVVLRVPMLHCDMRVFVLRMDNCIVPSPVINLSLWSDISGPEFAGNPAFRPGIFLVGDGWQHPCLINLNI